MSLKVIIAHPQNGTQKIIEYKDDKKWAKLIDKRMGQEFPGELLEEDWTGYIFRITGGTDRQGFSMKQGILTKKRVRLLLPPESKCIFAKREGTSFRKSVKGCIIGHNMSALQLVVVKKGEKEIEGLTDTEVPRRLGPKRANNIRKLFQLPSHASNRRKTKEERESVDPGVVCKFVVRRLAKTTGDKKSYKAPRITRLITETRLLRKKIRKQRKLDAIKNNQTRYQVYLKQRSKSRKSSMAVNKKK
jgi:small subunit ribosomal protein S6e